MRRETRKKKNQINHDHVEGRGGSSQGQARIAWHDFRLRRASRQELESAGVARDPDHFGIDLEKGPALALVSVTRKTAGAETDDRDLLEIARSPASCGDGLRKRAADVKVG